MTSFNNAKVERSFSLEIPQQQWDYDLRRQVPAGTLRGTVVVTVDLETIARIYGERALKSKSGKSVIANGLVTVRRVK